MDVIALAGEFVRLTKEKRRLAAECKANEQAIEKLQAQLLAQFEQSPNLSKLSVDGMTVFPKRQIFASPLVSREHAAATLVAAGFADFVQPNYNANSVSALVRELENDGKLEGSGLLAAFKLTEKFIVSATAAGGGNGNAEGNRGE